MTTYPSVNVRTLYIDRLNETLDGFFNVEDLRSYRDLAGNGEGPLHTLVGVLTNLQAYQARMMALFEDNKVLGSTELPKAYARRTLIDRAAEDLEVVLRALAQRMPPLSLNLDWVQRLKLADRLAFAALKPVMSDRIGGLLPEDVAMLRPTTAVTYFQKANSIRVIPYAPVALIGIPFSAATYDQDLLAIPHEIGHYVYWHEPLERGSLNGSLARHFWDQPAWLSAWQEEIFADVYGALVAGPYMAIDFQDILADTSRTRFITDDGEHPVSIARAYVFTSVLRAIGYDGVAGEIDAKWKQTVEATYGPTEEAVVGGQVLPLEEIIGRLDTVVRRIVNFDLPHMKIPAADTWSWGATTAGSEPVDLTRYQSNFETYVASYLTGANATGAQASVAPGLPFLEVDRMTTRLVLPGQGSLEPHALGETGSKLDEYLLAAEKEVRPIEPAVWYQLLSSGGWTTGPGDIITSGK